MVSHLIYFAVILKYLEQDLINFVLCDFFDNFEIGFLYRKFVHKKVYFHKTGYMMKGLGPVIIIF
jgi:hypothetical protein